MVREAVVVVTLVTQITEEDKIEVLKWVLGDPLGFLDWTWLKSCPRKRKKKKKMKLRRIHLQRLCSMTRKMKKLM